MATTTQIDALKAVLQRTRVGYNQRATLATSDAQALRDFISANPNVDVSAVVKAFNSLVDQVVISGAVISDAIKAADAMIADDPPPPKAPTIDTFTVTPDTAKVGDVVTVAWATSNADEVRLNGEIVAASGTKAVSVT